MTGSRDALLIATGAYEDKQLRTLRSPVQDVSGLAEVLSSSAIGDFRVEQLIDEPSRRITRSVEGFFRNRGRDDLLLVHISCHGLKDDDGRLYFAAADTDRDYLGSTAVPAGFLQDQMDRCRAKSIVLLLDCCYSGSFMRGAKGDDRVHIRDLSGSGRAILTATNRTEYAWEGDHVEASLPQPSRFTGAIIQGLRTGAADLNGDGWIGITELYEYVYETVRATGAKQTPLMWATLENQVFIASARTITVDDTRSARDSTGSGSSDIMDAFVGEATARGPRPRVRRGRDAMIRLEIELAEAVFGSTRKILVDTAVVCGTCSGEGVAPGTRWVVCDMCSGRGEVSQATRDGQGGQRLAARQCPLCHGFGLLAPTPCPECAEEGRVRARRTLNVKIPAGVDTGTRIRLKGEGEIGPGGGEAADLYIEIAEVPHSRYTRDHDDLLCHETIAAELAADGGTLAIETLDGERTIRIPADTVDGTKLRLRGLGVTHVNGGDRGDLYVKVGIRGRRKRKSGPGTGTV